MDDTKANRPKVLVIEGAKPGEIEIAKVMRMTYRHPCEICESDGFNIILAQDVVLCKTCIDNVYLLLKSKAKDNVQM